MNAHPKLDPALTLARTESIRNSTSITTPTPTPQASLSASQRPPLPKRETPVRSARLNHSREREGIQKKLQSLMGNLIAGSKPWPLYVWSKSPGTGKTSAGLVLLDHCGPVVDPMFNSDEARDVFGGFIDLASFPAFIRRLGQGQVRRTDGESSGRAVTETDFWRHYRRARVYVLDDLRKLSDAETRLGDDHYGLLKRLLDERSGLPLMVTSNLEPATANAGGQPELVKMYDDRIADRLLCGTVFHLPGQSRRGENPVLPPAPAAKAVEVPATPEQMQDLVRLLRESWC